MLKGFKEFIMRGNVIDLAVAVVIGAAFAPIIKALTDQLIYPLIGALFGKPSFDDVWVPVINGAEIHPFAVVTAIVNFLIVAFALYFLVVVPMNKANDRFKKPEEVAEEEKAPEILLLEEIRDLLRRG